MENLYVKDVKSEDVLHDIFKNFWNKLGYKDDLFMYMYTDKSKGLDLARYKNIERFNSLYLRNYKNMLQAI